MYYYYKCRWLFLTVPWVGLQSVIVVFPDHTHLIFKPDNIPYCTPNWLPAWSSVEVSQMQKDDLLIHFIMGNKMKNQKLNLNEIQQANSVIRALWFQWDSLGLRNGSLYHQWKDNKGGTIYQIVFPEDRPC